MTDLDSMLDAQPPDLAGAPPPQAGRWRRRMRRFGMVALVLTVTGTTAGLAGGYLIRSHLLGNIKRIDGAFQNVDGQRRPAPDPVAGGQTILAVGLDVRSPVQTTGTAAVDPKAAEGGERSDTIMLVRIGPDARSATVVSIPRDSWVEVPGHGLMKINASYALGGPALLIRTVEQLTGIRVDHFLILDFAGFQSIVDTLNGVDVQVAAATTDLGGRHFLKGTNHLNGDMALAYVRQRYGLPAGDLDRVRRQQNFLRAVFSKLAATHLVDDPVRGYHLLDAITRAVTVDSTYTDTELYRLALDALRLRSGQIWFLTAGVAGLGREGAQSVVYLDKARDAELWQAIRDDDTARYALAHPADQLGQVTP
ncbi:MAG TPA: LCP family protein [Rugosimonospora sp.]|nr:LCP family protein [Rugosimonospora sp.]